MNNNTAEKVFQMNLIRLAGNTSAVTIDHMLEFFAYANKNSVVEVIFVEQEYTASVFNNQVFDDANINIDSLQILIDKYEDAKKNNDPHFLKLLRDAHRQARAFLNEPEIKTKLKEIVSQRKFQSEYRGYMNVLTTVVDFMKDFGDNRLLNASLTTILPKLFDNVRLIGVDSPESEEKEQT